MGKSKYKRTEARLEHQWPVWFAEDFTETVSQGLMVDVSSGGLAFRCEAGENCPRVGQEISTRFSIPRSAEADDDSAITSITRSGRVLRVEQVSPFLRQVAIEFHEPLSLKPCEQAGIDLMHSRTATP
jgi:hypothetical protein